MTIGQKLSPILREIEDTLLEYQVHNGAKPDFTKEAISASIHIFSAVMQDKMWEMQEAEKMPQEEREKMAVWLGESIRTLVRQATNIDTWKLNK